MYSFSIRKVCIVIFFSLAATPAAAAPFLTTNAGVDSDDDGYPDHLDIAPLDPTSFDPGDHDFDGDGIGDVIDPEPSSAGPINYAGDLDIQTETAIITVGESYDLTYDIVSLELNLFGGALPGTYLAIDFGANGNTDAYLWQASEGNALSITADFFISSAWDLNTPGEYAINLTPRYSGIGFSSTFRMVTVLPSTESEVPAPRAMFLCLSGLLSLGFIRKRSRTADGIWP